MTLFVVQDIEIARERMARAGRTPEGKPYTAKVILGYLTSWKTLLFTLIFSKFPPRACTDTWLTLSISTAMQPFGSQPFTSFVFWLKAHNKKGQPPVYTVAQIVCTPSISSARTLPGLT
jgi:ACS family pantothenate transporter-like MFS transporter